MLLPDTPTAADWTAFLNETLASFGCASGTLHRLDPDDGLLKMVSYVRIPPPLLPIISIIPVGKGIAGAAAERRAPVELCNLQTDSSGVAKEGARSTQVQGSLAVPCLDGEALCGTLGIGKLEPYDFTAEEQARLMSIGTQIAARLAEAATLPSE